jgi:hypothetical protein
MNRSACLTRGSPRGMTAMGFFLVFGAATATLAGVTLIWPGTLLDRIWTLNASAYNQLAPFGKAIGIPFMLLGATMTAASLGWFWRRAWGWRLTAAVITMQVLGDLVNAFLGNIVKGGIGFAIAGTLLVYLLNARVRTAFVSMKP